MENQEIPTAKKKSPVRFIIIGIVLIVAGYLRV